MERRQGVCDREEDDEDREEQESVRPEDRGERTAHVGRTILDEGPGNVCGEDERGRGKPERRQQERLTLEEPLTNQLLHDLDVLLPGIDPVRRLPFAGDVRPEREGREER